MKIGRRRQAQISVSVAGRAGRAQPSSTWQQPPGQQASTSCSLAHQQAGSLPNLCICCLLPLCWHRSKCREERLLWQGRGLKDTNLQETQLKELEVSLAVQLRERPLLFLWQPCLKAPFLHQTPIFLSVVQKLDVKTALLLPIRALVILMAVSLCWLYVK